MTNFRKALLPAVVGALGLAIMAPPVASDGFGQFHVGRYTDNVEVDIWAGNPTAEEMFVLLIAYNPDGSLDTALGDDDAQDGCNSEIVPPHGGADDGDEGAFCTGSCDCKTCYEPTESPSLMEMIGVPTSGANEGVFGGNPNLGFITRINGKKGPPIAAVPDTSYFSLPGNAATAEALRVCACDELSEQGLPDTLLEGAGIFCTAAVSAPKSELKSARADLSSTRADN